MNLNFLKFKLSDNQFYVFIAVWFALCLLTLSYTLGYYNRASNAEICKEITMDRDLLVEQLNRLEKEQFSQVIEIENRIKDTQKQICREQIKKFKEEYKVLRCKICTGGSK